MIIHNAQFSIAGQCHEAVGYPLLITTTEGAFTTHEEWLLHTLGYNDISELNGQDWEVELSDMKTDKNYIVSFKCLTKAFPTFHEVLEARRCKHTNLDKFDNLTCCNDCGEIID